VILPVEVRDQLKAERGIYITEACDACGELLGAVRYTRRGEPGVWCSAQCRDGAEAVAARQERQRRGGRPRKYRNERERRQAERRQAADRQRAFRDRLGVTENPIAAD
jgi:hypothetical protein